LGDQARFLIFETIEALIESGEPILKRYGLIQKRKIEIIDDKNLEALLKCAKTVPEFHIFKNINQR